MFSKACRTIYSKGIKMNTSKTEESVIPATTHNYNEGTILRKVRADKYTNVISENYAVKSTETGARFTIKSSSMLELAQLDKEQDSFSCLLRNGYEGSGKMSAGAGIAVKMTKTDTSYECIFYTGEVGKSFDPKKVQSKDYIRLDKEHLGALFTFLRCDDAVSIAAAEASKLERTTLELN